MNLYDIAIARKLSGGGGGNSDFSTAQVTLTIGAGKAQLPFPYIMGITMGVLVVMEQGFPTGTFEMPLYKGQLVIRPISVTGTVSTSGACEYDNNAFIITGDCTITIN